MRVHTCACPVCCAQVCVFTRVLDVRPRAACCVPSTASSGTLWDRRSEQGERSGGCGMPCADSGGSRVRMASGLLAASGAPGLSLSPPTCLRCLVRTARGPASDKRRAPHGSPSRQEEEQTLTSPSEGATGKPPPPVSEQGSSSRTPEAPRLLGSLNVPDLGAWHIRRRSLQPGGRASK